MKKVTVCLLSIDRYWMTRYTIESLLRKAGEVHIELLVLDNGSKDKRLIAWLDELQEQLKLNEPNPEHYPSLVSVGYIEEPENIGVAKGFNKLFREATGDYICTVGNDITVENAWVSDLIYYCEAVEKSGIVAIHCLLDKGKFTSLLSSEKDEFVRVFKPDTNMVYGISLFKREILEKVGGFDETLSKYGCEDSQFAFRVAASGYNNFYIPGQSSVHIGHDFGEKTEYRKMKDENLKIANERLKETIDKMKKERKYFIPYV